MLARLTAGRFLSSAVRHIKEESSYNAGLKGLRSEGMKEKAGAVCIIGRATIVKTIGTGDG